MTAFVRWILGASLLGPAFAQPPAIFQDGVSNAASRVSTVLPFGAVAPGARIRLSGVRFGNHPILILKSHDSSFKIKSLKTAERTAEFQLPRQMPLGDAELSVEAEGGESRVFPLRITASAFGIQALSRSNRVVTLEGTGLGGGGEFEVVAAGIAIPADSTSSGDDGIDQIRFRIPENLPKGCHLPVYVRTKSHVSNFVDLADLPGCKDEEWPILNPRPKGAGSLILLRSTLSAPPRSWTMDTAYAIFLTPGKRHLEAPLWFPLSPGQCRIQVSTEPLQRDALHLPRINAAVHSSISAGSAIFCNKRALGPDSTGAYHANLGGSSPATRRRSPLFFEAGKNYALSAEGGKTGRFAVKAPFIDDLDFSLTGDRIDRSQRLTVRWRTSQPMVAVVVHSQTSSSIVEAVCAVDGSLGEFAVPMDILRSLPPSDDAPGALTGYVAVAAISRGTAFHSKGLDRGIASAVRIQTHRTAFY